ncbi:MAG: tetratricopeptide repeat protein, partial [Lachnospiraceae bacterium]
MRCYRCGSVLSETDYCNSCGTDVAVYKKIVRLSNTYYNMGLEKAKIRDLSGAADLLRRSVRMDKKNIQARNLLGLVYYEMGEFVEALSQWVISKNIQPDKNVADEYLKDAQSNPTRLEAMNMTIKKYNTALKYALEGSDDLGIIQLKKVINLNPKFVKAYQLLSLLYMKKEEYGRAKKYLNKSLTIDYNNT